VVQGIGPEFKPQYPPKKRTHSMVLPSLGRGSVRGFEAYLTITSFTVNVYSSLMESQCKDEDVLTCYDLCQKTTLAVKGRRGTGWQSGTLEVQARGDSYGLH
jgi:hypothetical protein